MKTVQFLGYKGGGKTRAISQLVQALASRGQRVGTVKHVHGSFTVDARGKDTWVHANSGARIVVAVSSEETVTIAKRDAKRVSINKILKSFGENDIEYALVEGFSKEFSQKGDAVQVICARSREDALGLMRIHKKPACIIGGLDDDPDCDGIGNAPVLRLPKDLPRLLRLIGEA